MKKRTIFMLLMLTSCALLFLQRFTGMAVHAIVGLAVLIASICHTMKFKKVWKKRSTGKKAVEIALWAGLTGATVSGFLLKPVGEVVAVLLVHKLSAVVFVVFLLWHIKLCPPRKKAKKKS